MHRRVLTSAVVFLAAVAGWPACTNAGEEPALITETHVIRTFDLAPAGTAGAEDKLVALPIPRPAGDLVLKKMRFFVADETGRELNLADDGVHLHHVVMMSTKTKDGACPDSGYARFGQRFAASGNEKTPIVLPNGYGYHVGAGDTWGALWHLMNMGPAPRPGRLGYEISYVKGTPSVPQTDVTPYYLDVAGCTSSDFDLPGGGAPGSVTAKEVTVTMPRTGWAVFTLGHLHDGGIDVSLRDPGGLTRCTATASYAGDGHSMDHHGGGASASIAAMSACPARFDVKAGDSWTVSARYPGDAAYKDVMGVIFTYLAH